MATATTTTNLRATIRSHESAVRDGEVQTTMMGTKLPSDDLVGAVNRRRLHLPPQLPVNLPSNHCLDWGCQECPPICHLNSIRNSQDARIVYEKSTPRCKIWIERPQESMHCLVDIGIGPLLHHLVRSPCLYIFTLEQCALTFLLLASSFLLQCTVLMERERIPEPSVGGND